MHVVAPMVPWRVLASALLSSAWVANAFEKELLVLMALMILMRGAVSAEDLLPPETTAENAELLARTMQLRLHLSTN